MPISRPAQLEDIVIPEPDPTRILELIHTEKIETAFMVPALIQFLLSSQQGQRKELGAMMSGINQKKPYLMHLIQKD